MDASASKTLTAPPKVWETLLVFAVTVAISYMVGFFVRPLAAQTDYLILVSWATHIPQLLIPWLWYRLRVVPALPTNRRPLLRWPPGSTRPLLLIALWMVGLKFLGSMVSAWIAPTPQWVYTGLVNIALILLFQGLFVGISEE